MSELGYFTGASCPWCGKPKHLASTLTDGKGPPPVPGDIALCISCGNWAIFDPQLQMRKPSKRERAELRKDPDVQDAARRWEAMNRKMKRMQ